MSTVESSGGFRGGRSLAPPPFGRRTDAVTVFLISDAKHALQNTQNDCHKWLSRSFRVYQIRAGKNLVFLKEAFWFLGLKKLRFLKVFCTKTEHESTTQKHMKNITYTVRSILLKTNIQSWSSEG